MNSQWDKVLGCFAYGNESKAPIPTKEIVKKKYGDWRENKTKVQSRTP